VEGTVVDASIFADTILDDSTITSQANNYKKLFGGTDVNLSDINISSVAATMAQVIDNNISDNDLNTTLTNAITNSSIKNNITIDTNTSSIEETIIDINTSDTALDEVGQKIQSLKDDLTILNNNLKVDKLALKDNNISIGGVVVTLSDGNFSTVSHDTVNSDNLSDYYSVSFGLTNILVNSKKYQSLEDGKSMLVNLGIFVKDITTNNSPKRLFVMMNDVNISRNGESKTPKFRIDGTSTVSDINNSNVESVSVANAVTILNKPTYDGTFSVVVGADSNLTGYGQKEVNTRVSSTIQNFVQNGPISTDENGNITYDLSNAIDKLISSNSSYDTLKNQLSQKGKYEISLYISGDDLDGVVNANTVSNIVPEFLSGMQTDINNTFSGTIYRIQGQVWIGYSATQIVADVNSSLNDSYSSFNNFNFTANSDIMSGNITLPSSLSSVNETHSITWESNNTNAITNSGVVTKKLTTQSHYNIEILLYL
jgi:hypothetical protein